MTIDEQLQKLKERHEALAQSMELLITFQRENDQRYAERFARTEERLAQLMETMNRLANIVISHEERLDDIQGRS